MIPTFEDIHKPGRGDDFSAYEEVILNDCYRLRQSEAEGFKPKLIYDLGTHMGATSILMHHLWPEAKIIGVEFKQDAIQAYKKNCLFATMIEAFVIGYPENKNLFSASPWEEDIRQSNGGISISQLMGLFGTPDLLKIDIESAELYVMDEWLRNHHMTIPKLIVGEYHFPFNEAGLKRILPRYYDCEFLQTDADKYGKGGYWAGFFAKKNVI